MALSRPPDYTKIFLVGALGVGTAVIIHFLRRNELPHVGDNLHHLPYGGSYCDGTKSISYSGSFNKKTAVTFNPLLLIFILSALIYVSSRRDSLSVGFHSCRTCSNVHIRCDR
nr:triple gene block protein 3 [Banmivirus BanMMV]UTM72630.1 triple gene block protein 3 [Banmivirus BanMMV]UUL90893.1 triple gene block protein 3 [Banmivirus BanMMV]